MYIEITNYCNMTCAHCCGNYPLSGENMSFETFKKALEYSSEYVAIGGGEPTLHPEFEKFIFYAMGQKWMDNVWLATNGTHKERTLALLNMSQHTDLISVALSLDEFHDPIDYEIIEAFKKSKSEIRDTSDNLINSGRCDFGKDGCCCPGIMVKVNGDVYPCECLDAPKIGDVFNGFDESYYEYDCYKEKEMK